MVTQPSSYDTINWRHLAPHPGPLSPMGGTQVTNKMKSNHTTNIPGAVPNLVTMPPETDDSPHQHTILPETFVNTTSTTAR